MEANTQAQGLCVSLSFWVVLLVSGTLFALIVLAPRIETWIDLAKQYSANEEEYRRLQSDTTLFETTAFALENDPGYAVRLAMQDLDLKPAGRLLTEAPPPEQATLPAGSPVQHASLPDSGSLRSLVREFAAPGQFRSMGIWGAAGLCLFAFVCLNDGFFERGPGRMISEFWKFWASRYRHVNRADDR